MTESEFQRYLSRLRTAKFREDFETALFALYTGCEPAQRAAFRRDLTAGKLQPPTAWRNPTDYFRSDLTREQRLRQSLIRMSIAGRSGDYREDLCALAYIYHNLLLLKLNADGILEDVAHLSDEDFGELVRAFTRRQPMDKSLEAFNLKVFETPDGPVADRVN